MTHTPSALLAYADRLLTGTGLDGTRAEAAATATLPDTPAQASTAAAALRDGWNAAEQATTDHTAPDAAS